MNKKRTGLFNKTIYLFKRISEKNNQTIKQKPIKIQAKKLFP